MSIPDQRWTVHLTWFPGAYKLPTAPGGSWRRDSPGWEKAEDKFTATSGLRVCVCVCVCASTEIPENMTLWLLDHTGPLLEGQQYWLECVVESVAPAKNLTVIWIRGDTELKHS